MSAGTSINPSANKSGWTPDLAEAAVGDAPRTRGRTAAATPHRSGTQPLIAVQRVGRNTSGLVVVSHGQCNTEFQIVWGAL